MNHLFQKISKKNHLDIINRSLKNDDEEEVEEVELYTNDQYWMNPLFEETENLPQIKKKRKKKIRFRRRI